MKAIEQAIEMVLGTINWIVSDGSEPLDPQDFEEEEEESFEMQLKRLLA